MTDAGRVRFSVRAIELRTRGRDAVEGLPDADEVAGRPADERHRVLESLRVELYAIASIVADAAVQRALQERSSYPPYGLVRSMYSQLRMLAANPGPVEEGAVDTFHALGLAYLDTMVFHLDRQLRVQAASPEGWLIRRLEQLVALFRIDAGPANRERLRNPFSFMYGGMHFGVSVCSQLTEVMARLLEPFDAGAAEKGRVMARSLRPAYRLAALNLDHVIPVYQSLLEPSGWMGSDHFTVQLSNDRPWRIDLRDEAVSGRQHDPGRPGTYPTQGCPARSSPTGGSSAIAALWRWSVELAHDTGLLGPVDAGVGGDWLQGVVGEH